MSRPTTPKREILRTLIFSKAATPEGFASGDAHHLPNAADGSKLCARLVKSGLLHSAKVPTHHQRYFATQAAAEHYKATAQPKTPDYYRAYARDNYHSTYSVTAKAKRAGLPKPPRQPKVIKIIERTAKQQMQVVQRKPYTPPAPRADAEPIHTAQTRYSSRPWVDLRAVTAPYRRIGQPGWSMSI